MRPLIIPTALISLSLICSCSSGNKTGAAISKAKAETKVVLPAQQVFTPADINYVYDYENLFTQQEEQKLDSLVRTFEKSNLIAIKVVSVNDPAVTVANFDQHIKTLLNEWSANHGKSDKCMIIGISKSLNRIHVEYGAFVSRLLSTQETNAIVEDRFRPSFKQGHFYEGTWNGATVLLDTIRKNIRF